ncbi:MAG: DUF4388 domain-containing protein [Acidimicrobiia bacterium]
MIPGEFLNCGLAVSDICGQHPLIEGPDEAEGNPQGSGMNLSGELSDWPVADLLNMLKVTNKTATLHVRADRSGVVHFVSGRVSGAAVTGDAVLEGDVGSRPATVDALFVLSGFDKGSFELVSYQGPEGDGWEIEDLLADMDRLQELEVDVAGAGLSSGRLMLKDVISGPVTVVEEDWWAVASLVSVLSLQQLEQVFGRARAVRLLHTLWRLGLVETLAEPEPLAERAEPTPAAQASLAQPSDEAWLDEIALSQQVEQAPAVMVDEVDRKRVTGVSAPASTVLTGSVLDEMRRLRSRTGE